MERYQGNREKSALIAKLLGGELPRPGFDVYEKSAAQLLAAMDAGKLSSRELTAWYLHRIMVYDGLLNAMISINTKVLEQAEECDRLRKAGKGGPLCGLPIVVKDNMPTHDLPTTQGSLVLRDIRPQKDAFVVKMLRDAGAILLGKTNLSELASAGMSEGSLVGQTLNPYDLIRTPGASSGGSGAAVAANLAVAGLGTDGVNSVRSPASACCLVGIRPTKGLVSCGGLVPASTTQDMPGALARTVGDIALLMNSMATYDPADPYCELIKDKKLPDFTALAPGAAKGKRIAILTTDVGSDPEVTRIVAETADALRRAGAEVFDLDGDLLDMDRMQKECNVLRYEQKGCMDGYFSTEPTSPYNTLEEILATETAVPGVASVLKGVAALQDPLNDPEYKRRIQNSKDLKIQAENLMKEKNIDAFLYPLQTVPVAPVGNPGGQPGRNGIMAAALGFPAVTFPGGYTAATTTARQGVPVGMELMGAPLSDKMLLEIAADLESRSAIRQAPAGFISY